MVPFLKLLLDHAALAEIQRHLRVQRLLRRLAALENVVLRQVERDGVWRAIGQYFAFCCCQKNALQVTREHLLWVSERSKSLGMPLNWLLILSSPCAMLTGSWKTALGSYEAYD